MSQRGCTPLDTPVCPVRHDRRRTDTDKQFVEPKKQETNMGYISIQINKAKGSADTGASDHIERKTTPKNADPTRTHLNRELVQFPDGVADRTEAISHRIRTAGIRRKITPDQVRAIRIVLSGTHEDMVRVQDEAGWTNGAVTTCNGCTARSEKRTPFRQCCTWTSTHRTSTPR